MLEDIYTAIKYAPSGTFMTYATVSSDGLAKISTHVSAILGRVCEVAALLLMVPGQPPSLWVPTAQAAPTEKVSEGEAPPRRGDGLCVLLAMGRTQTHLVLQVRCVCSAGVKRS